jgi:hypothetical protein
MHAHTHTHTHYIINNPIRKNQADVGRQNQSLMKQNIKTFILQFNCGIFSLGIGWHIYSRVR